jgi:acyl-CoA synthetase (AMP-forming)/AMP-acid ligase II
MVPVANKALELAGLKVNELDAFIPHQANMRIIDAMVKALDLPPEIAVARDIRVSGNTSAASIPLAMEAMLENFTTDKAENPENGEILMQAPWLMKGYFEDEDLTSQVIKNNWLHTGDMGRIDAEGFEVEPINTREIIEKLRALNCPPESIAICLLFSPLNPSHEQEIASALAIEFPQARMVCSHTIFPHLGEYERTLATVKSLGLEVPQQLTTESIREKNRDDLFASQLEEIANRMQQQILDAAVSSVVREAMDCAAALFLPDGRMISQARTLPLLSGSLSPAVKGLLQAFPIEFMMEGDGYLVNDPWSGGTHLPDFVLLRPIFRQGEVQA